MKKNTIFNSKPIIGLVPMAGYTDTAFRQICKEYGADLVYTEMISANGVVHDWKDRRDKKKHPSLDLAKFDEVERPIFVQIFGSDPKIMAEAAKIISEKYIPDGIDINAGCPAPKVIKNKYGSYLMKNPETVVRIIKAMKKVLPKTPISVKTRLGWDNLNEVYTNATMWEDAGLDMLAVHCRTYEGKFHSLPEWEKIAHLKQIIQIPILANGGITDWESAQRCLDISKADGILIGRAALGRPWIFKEIKDKNEIKNNFEEVSIIVNKHMNIAIQSGSSFEESRGHLLHYYKGFINSAKLRSELMQCRGINDYEKVIEEFKRSIA